MPTGPPKRLGGTAVDSRTWQGSVRNCKAQGLSLRAIKLPAGMEPADWLSQRPHGVFGSLPGWITWGVVQEHTGALRGLGVERGLA